MKLRSCHIDNFGKLSDLHLEFHANPMKPILDKIELGQMEEWNFTASDGSCSPCRPASPYWPCRRSHWQPTPIGALPT